MNKKLLAKLAMLWALLPGLAFAADPAAGVPNTWLLDNNGRIYGAYELGSGGQWTAQASKQSSNKAVISFAGGGSQSLPADLQNGASDSVIVNNTPASYPPTSNNRPPISIVGVGNAIGNSQISNKPGVQVEARVRPIPPDVKTTLANTDTTQYTIEFIMQAYPAPNKRGDDAGLQLSWDIDGSSTSENVAGDHSRTVYLAANGTYNISVHTTQSGIDSDPSVWQLTIAGADPLRDSIDGDGIPDVAEAALGLNPYLTDVNADNNDDGVPDFLAVFCSAYTITNIAANIDTDLDGASDCEEKLRGTNPNDARLAPLPAPFPDRPAVVGSLYAPEHLLSGSVYADIDQTTKKGMARLRVTSLPGNVFYDSQDLATDADISAQGISPAAVPDYRRSKKVLDPLGSGDFLNTIRLPADQSLVLYVREDAGKWNARAWINQRQNLTPARVTPLLIDAGTTWTTGEQWLEAFGNYLKDNLVQPVGVNVSPDTGLGLALMDAIVNFYDNSSAGAQTLLGSPEDAPSPDAASAVRRALAGGFDEQDRDAVATGRSLDDLHGELALIFLLGQFIEQADPVRQSIVGYYADTGAVTEATVLHQVAALLQTEQDPLAACCLQMQYLATLLPRMPLNDIFTLYGGLHDPLADYDLDGLLNYQEMQSPPPLGSDPRFADTDGDTYTDDYDPCPASALNNCLFEPYQAMDTDADGVIDSFDNCLNLANPQQTNTDLDNIGDACFRHAAIDTPNSNLRIFTGTTLTFTSKLPAAGSVLPLVYNWSFDGNAPGNTAANPPPVTFNTPGDYIISLAVTDNNGAGTTTAIDTRKISVFAPAPGPSVSMPALTIGQEGIAMPFSASIIPGGGSIATVTWQFGDSSAANGNPVNHTYAANGIYTATVKVTDSGNNIAMATGNVQVVDAVPTASFDVDAVKGKAPFTVNFTNTTITHDPIVSYSWDFDDGTATQSSENVQHTFQSPGIYAVRLTVTDNDGSVADVIVAIEALPDAEMIPTHSIWVSLLWTALVAAVVLRRRRRR